MKEPQVNEIVLWSTADGIRCVVLPYDERRYQLRLLRPQGTIKADLFFDYEAALTAAQEWRHQVDVTPRLSVAS